MSRPIPIAYSAGLESWDVELQKNTDLLFATPFPVAESANRAALPDPTLYDGCQAEVEDTREQVFSDGSTWVNQALGKLPFRAIVSSETQVEGDAVVAAAGTLTYTLQPVVSWALQSVYVYCQAGILTIDGAGAELVNGAATLVLTVGQCVRVYSTGNAGIGSITLSSNF